jgi:uncharacterized membrane protein
MHNESASPRSRETKREQFVTDAKPKSKAVPVMVGVLVALAAVAAFLVVRSSSDRPAATTVTTGSPAEKQGASQPAPAAGDTPGAAIRIPLADLSSQAKFFDYPSADGRKIRFFAIKSPDGAYRAALDACDVCFHAKKGYRQEGDQMICNNCGLPFEVAKIGSVAGGCNPVGLPRTVEGSELVIKASDLQSGARYF